MTYKTEEKELLAFTATQSKLKAFEYHGMKINSFILARNFSINLYHHMWNYKIAMATFRTSQCQDGVNV